MTNEDDKDWSADLKAIEDRIGGRESPQIIAPVMRDLLDKIAEISRIALARCVCAASCSTAAATPRRRSRICTRRGRRPSSSKTSPRP